MYAKGVNKRIEKVYSYRAACIGDNANRVMEKEQVAPASKGAGEGSLLSGVGNMLGLDVDHPIDDLVGTLLMPDGEHMSMYFARFTPLVWAHAHL